MYIINHLGIVYGPYGGIGCIVQQRRTQGGVVTPPRVSRCSRFKRLITRLHALLF
jgi:hypothetical protein